ncbi:c-type cytochrome [Actimicrobium antarcticum]|uniref:C-type cytochrome n=1 Tax=Actimicrobium antarcticum TaxID=1051899 RepID=A0ABP7U1K2_9BURK
MKLKHIFAGLLLALTLPAYAADLAAGKEKAQACFACHGVNGNSTVPMFPVLAGQNARYIYLQLRDYKEGARTNPVMSPMAANLSKADMQDIAAYFSEQKPQLIEFKADPARVKLGFQKADETLCSMCHLGGLKGQNEIPKLSGQHYDYIFKQLTNFKERTRTNDAGNMTAVAKTLSDEDIINLSHYIANLN